METSEISPEISDKLLHLAGKGSALHRKFSIYLDIVKSAIPFLPQKPIFHPVSHMNNLTHFNIEVLDIIDVVISKLSPFRAHDVSDIRFLIGKNLLPHDRLVERCHAIIDYYSMAKPDDLPKFVRNLNTVERDMLLVPESKIELPEWI